MRPTWRTVLIAVLASVLIAPSLFAQTLTVKVQRGNVRSGPGKSYPVIGRVQKADNFPIEARQGDWFKILLETGREGWVFKSLVEVSGKRSIGVVPSGPAPSASRPYGDSWALVVGINRYRKRSLRLSYAVNDAWIAPGLLDTRVRVFDLMRPPQLERVFPALPGPAFGSRSPRESNDGCTGS